MLAIFKMLANVNRVTILRAINSAKDKTLTVSEIEELMDISQSTISDHLKLMRVQKIVRAKQDGLNMHYSISDPFVTELIIRMD